MDDLRVFRDAGTGPDQFLWLPILSCVDLTGDKVERKVPEGFEPKREDTVIAVISEPKVDRMGDVVMDSWRLASFRRNPIVLWGHDSSTPAVGRALQTELIGEEGKRRLVQEIQFDTSDPLGAALARKYSEGILRAFSVGFRSHKRSWRVELLADDPYRVTSGNRWNGGEKLEDNELFENSAVNVPALQTALAVRRASTEDEETAWLDRVKWALQNDPEMRQIVRDLLPAPGPTNPPGPASLADLFSH